MRPHSDCRAPDRAVGHGQGMNARQVGSVLVGLLIFAVGALVGLRPVEGPGGGPTAALPLLDPVEALALSPAQVLLAALVLALGLAVALLGCYAARDRD